MTIAQIECSSAGIAVWAEYASVIESYKDQKFMGLLKDCPGLGVADNIRKADEHCQKLLKHTGIQDMIEERCNSRSAMPTSIFSWSVAYFGHSPVRDGGCGWLEINMNEEWRDVEFEVAFD